MPDNNYKFSRVCSYPECNRHTTTKAILTVNNILDLRTGNRFGVELQLGAGMCAKHSNTLNIDSIMCESNSGDFYVFLRRHGVNVIPNRCDLSIHFEKIVEGELLETLQ